MKQQTIIIILVLIALSVLAWKFGRQSMQVFDIYTDTRCSRNGEVVTCTGNAQNYGACGFDYGKRYFGYCYKDGLGDNFAEWLQGRLGETYALNSEQKQAVYDNLKLSGNCRFGYDKGTLWGNANDPSFPTDSCTYTYLFVDTLSDGSYSQISSCQNKQLGTCGSVPVDVNRCNGEYPQGWKSSPISIFFTPYSERGTFGSCTLTTRMAQPVTPPPCPNILDFDISKPYEIRSIAIWQKDDCDNWHSYIPNELGNTLNVNINDYCRVIPDSNLCRIPPIPPPKPKPVFIVIIDKIIDWLKSLFSWLISFQITGVSQPLVGSIQTYDISISAPTPDSDYSDGSYQLQYANWALIDKNNQIVQEGVWEEITGSYSKSVTLTVPSQPSNYALITTIYQYDMVYDTATKTWTIIKEDVAAKEAFNIRTVPPTPIKPTPTFGSIIQKIIDWITNFFKGIFG